uniref:Uncharacterized protein n=1 Tax=Solanum tuberosum TaxID=4113 RepID=M1DYX0_SOLTU
MGIETLAAKIQGYELRSGGYRVFSSFPRRIVKEELFSGICKSMEREKGDVDVIETVTSPPNRWSEAKSGEFYQAPIGGVRSIFDMYSLRSAEFDDVCYVRPPVGGV